MATSTARRRPRTVRRSRRAGPLARIEGEAMSSTKSVRRIGLAACLLLVPFVAHASHIAGVSVTATSVSGLSVDFRVGESIVSNGYGGAYLTVAFGDSSFDGVPLPLISSGTISRFAGAVSHTYAAPG